jgi:glycosyltransferase involved in cell wall biosynthesis
VRVLIFTSSLQVGGGEALTIALAKALVLEGLEVHFASAGGTLLRNMDKRVIYHATDNANHLPVRVAHAISLLLREIRPDLIHSHGGSCAMVASIARKASKVPCARVLTHHSGLFRRAPRVIMRPILTRSADHYIAISHDKQAVLESLGIPRDKISLIPNFVDVASVAARVAGTDTARLRHDLGIPDHARVLMMAGRVWGTKRFDVFVRVAAETARRMRGQEIHALVVGDGPALSNLREIARDEGAPATIHFLG